MPKRNEALQRRIEAFERRIAEAPKHLTLRQISEITGASYQTVRQFWAGSETFPQSVGRLGGGPKAAKLYDRDEFAQWYREEKLKDDPSRPGPRLTPPRPTGARHGRFTLNEFAQRYDISPRAMRYYAKRYGDDPEDPFPPSEGGDGRGGGTRDSRAVDPWMNRHRNRQPDDSPGGAS